MFENVRYKFGTKLLQVAHEEIKRGNFDSIMKGLKYTKLAIAIVPNSKETQKFGNEMKRIIESQTEKIES